MIYLLSSMGARELKWRLSVILALRAFFLLDPLLSLKRHQILELYCVIIINSN